MAEATCSIDGCERVRLTRGWCSNHYALWRRNGVPERVKGRERPCAVEGCGRSASARGWCSGHYQRWWETGDPGLAKIRVSRRPVMDGHKTCGTCNKPKPLADFNFHPHGSGEVGANCRLCLAAASKAWFAANPDYRAKWRTANADRVLDATHRRRALRSGGESEKIDPAVVFERDDFTCQLCSERMNMTALRFDPLGPTLDHVVPLSRGGSHTYVNVQAAHFYCNVSKGNREAPLTRPD